MITTKKILTISLATIQFTECRFDKRIEKNYGFLFHKNLSFKSIRAERLNVFCFMYIFKICRVISLVLIFYNYFTIILLRVSVNAL